MVIPGDFERDLESSGSSKIVEVASSCTKQAASSGFIRSACCMLETLARSWLSISSAFFSIVAAGIAHGCCW